jgi:hypothetical protein
MVRSLMCEQKGPKKVNMPKVPLSLSLLLAAAMPANGQNLVPNPGFEIENDCASIVYSTIEMASPWYTPTLSTPDVYDMDTVAPCGYAYDANVEFFWGPMPAMSGSRVAGLIMYELFSDVKEYIAVKLSQPLDSGASYTVSFKYRLGASCQFALHQFGILFQTDSTAQPDPYTIDSVPSVLLSNGSVLDGTTAWEALQATYTACGHERYLIIGSFEDTGSVMLTERPGHFDPQTYYFIDDVGVTPDVPVGSIEELTIFASASGVRVEVPSGGVIDEWKVIDIAGRMVQAGSMPLGPGCFDLGIPLDALPNGGYLLLCSIRGRTVARRFVYAR